MKFRDFKDNYYTQMVPEWRSGYLDYRILKQAIKPYKILAKFCINQEVKIKHLKKTSYIINVTNLTDN